MKINKARRGFLKLMPALPFGASAAAKEAAASMGLAGQLGAGLALPSGVPSVPGYYGDTSSSEPWFVRGLRELEIRAQEKSYLERELANWSQASKAGTLVQAVMG